MSNYSETNIEEEEDTQTGRFLTFLLDKEMYGIEIKCITEIMGNQSITKVPEMPDYIKGIINLRGKIVPVMDVRLRFGKEPREYDDRTCVIVIDLSGMPMGLIVDSVSEVLTIPEKDIAELPTANMGHSSGYIKNIGKLETRVVLILDSQKLLSADELESISTSF